MDRNLGLTSVLHAKIWSMCGNSISTIFAKQSRNSSCCACRAVDALLLGQATQSRSVSDWPAADACITLAPHLPPSHLATLATRLLSAVGEDSDSSATTAALTEAGLTLANRFFAAGVAGGPYPAVVKAVAALVGKGASAAAEECLAEAHPSRLSEPTMTAWSVSSIFAVLFFAVNSDRSFQQMGSMAKMTCMAVFDLCCEERRCVRSGTCQRAPRRSWNSALLSPAHFADA